MRGDICISRVEMITGIDILASAFCLTKKMESGTKHGPAPHIPCYMPICEPISPAKTTSASSLEEVLRENTENLMQLRIDMLSLTSQMEIQQEHLLTMRHLLNTQQDMLFNHSANIDQFRKPT
jgi:hypothetical protein